MEVIQDVLEGRDTVVIMPTGSGKSLCYQLSSMLTEGITIVISPLIALMKDQVDGLTKHRIPATYINSSLSAQEMHDRIGALRQGRYKLVYIAPERFRHQRFVDALNSVRISIIAIDEAHCISQWGHDFRPDYLRLHKVIQQRPHARVMALTATATPDVRDNIVKQLELGRGQRDPPRVLVYGFTRPNLRLQVARVSSHEEKLSHVVDAITRYKTGIIYCATRKQSERVHQLLKREGLSRGLYHGGLTDEERARAQEQFLQGEAAVVVATNAFGMGIDRPDIRFVIHWDIPGSIEAYYQEIGRAGRDGQDSLCALLYNYADVKTQEFFLDGSNPAPQHVETVWNAVRTHCLHGPATYSAAEWTQRISGLRNEMAVRTIMAILERSGLLQRTLEPGQKKYTTSLVEGADLASLEQQLAFLKEKRSRDERKLKIMLRYVNAPGCRHAYILKYFGEQHAPSSCSACDRCVPLTPGNTREPMEDEWEVVQKILSCVVRMNGRFGATRVVQVLVGSKAKTVLDRGLDRLSTYGLLADRGEKYARAVLDELIRVECVQVDDGEYPLVRITPKGRAAVQRKETIALRWPEKATKDLQKVASGSTPFPESTLYDQNLYDRLKEWRKKTAQGDHVPAYVVFHDKTLKAIAAVCPRSHAELERITGIGPAKVSKYGDAIMEIVDASK